MKLSKLSEQVMVPYTMNSGVASVEYGNYDEIFKPFVDLDVGMLAL